MIIPLICFNIAGLYVEHSLCPNSSLEIVKTAIYGIYQYKVLPFGDDTCKQLQYVL